MYTKFPLFKGEKIESSDLKNVLENLGIVLRDEELEKLLKILPVDGESCQCSSPLSLFCYVDLSTSIDYRNTILTPLTFCLGL